MATYYLATTGSDTTGDGSAGNPWRKLSRAGTAVVAGDTVYVKGSAGNASSYPTSSLDYSETTYFTPTAGSQSAGWVRWLPDPSGPTPTIGAPGLIMYSLSWQWIEGLYFVATTNPNGTLGVLNGGPIRVKGCTLNLNNQASQGGILMSSNGGAISGCEIYGGTTSPVASSGAFGISASAGVVAANRVHHVRGPGIADANSTSSVRIAGNRIYRNAGDGITLAGTTTGVADFVAGNTIDQNGGHGIAVTGTAGIATVAIYDNLITNHTGTGKSGLSVSDGTLAVNNARKLFCNYNAFYNNSSNYGGTPTISAGDADVDLGATAPGYADAANGDFTPTAAALQAGL